MEDSIENREKKFICILRRTEEGIPNFETMEDAVAEMPQYFLITSCTGKFLQSLLETTREVKTFF